MVGQRERCYVPSSDLEPLVRGYAPSGVASTRVRAYVPSSDVNRAPVAYKPSGVVERLVRKERVTVSTKQIIGTRSFSDTTACTKSVVSFKAPAPVVPAKCEVKKPIALLYPLVSYTKQLKSGNNWAKTKTSNIIATLKKCETSMDALVPGVYTDADFSKIETLYRVKLDDPVVCTKFADIREGLIGKMHVLKVNLGLA